MKGTLLALEGISGAGKSTLRDRLLSAARAEGLPLGHIGQFSWLSLPATRTIVHLRSGRRAATSADAMQAARRDLELHGRYNLAPALARGHVVADRLTLSTACLLALVHRLPVADCVQQLAEVPAARAHVTILLTTQPALCHERLSRRATPRRFGEDPSTAARLADLYEQAAAAWTETTGLPVRRHPCTNDTDLDGLTTICLARLLRAPLRTAPPQRSTPL
ncbi:dTMP kinase [Streptomyces roseolus]|uniref:dTMP kinase n=1 Tax=Streptomyces roseolus TaxID=67358 RepID=UPI00365A94C2